MEADESLQQAAQREIKEECAVEVDDLRHIGFMRYEYDGHPETAIVHIFTGTQIRGNPEPSEEMNPVQWYHQKELKHLKTYDDFHEWQQHVFANKFFCGSVRYDQAKQIVEKNIEVHHSLDDVLKCLH